MYYIDIAGIAQSVEQRTENPCVTSSNLVPGKKKMTCHIGRSRVQLVKMSFETIFVSNFVTYKFAKSN